MGNSLANEELKVTEAEYWITMWRELGPSYDEWRLVKHMAGDVEETLRTK